MHTISEYINSFYAPTDLQSLVSPVNIQLTETPIDNEYILLCNKILSLLDENLKNKYRIEIGNKCRVLIKALFDTYVDNDTFVITSNGDHEATLSQLQKKKYYLSNLFEIVNAPDIALEKILAAFKKSNCKKLFCIMVSTAPQSAITIDQDFFKNLKLRLLKEKIEHILILDDCQSIFVVEKNYELFDGFLATGHVLSPIFPNFGLLFTKLPKRCGIINKNSLVELYPKLQVINKYKDKAKQFNHILNTYFLDVLEKTGFKQFKNEAPHQFSIALPNVLNTEKYDAKFSKYNIRINPANVSANFIRIRYHEAIIQDPTELIKGLEEVKKYLVKMYRYKELAVTPQTYDESIRVFDTDLKDVKLNRNFEKVLTLEQLELINTRFFAYMPVRVK